jgi:hypothetical protein
LMWLKYRVAISGLIAGTNLRTRNAVIGLNLQPTPAVQNSEFWYRIHSARY